MTNNNEMIYDDYLDDLFNYYKELETEVECQKCYVKTICNYCSSVNSCFPDIFAIEKICN